MRIVVTGASGNLGSRLVPALLDDPAVESVVALARRTPTEGRPTSERLTWASADVADDDLVPILRGADCVVHLAWLFQPTHQPDLTWRANAVGTSRLLDAVAEAGVRAVVVASSIGAYSPRTSLSPVTEDWPTHGPSKASYAREKAYVERLLDAFEARHSEARVVRMRPAFIFQRAAATQQRRLFAGPLVPGSLVRPSLLPVLPVPRGLHLQALHADDAAQAFRLAATLPVSGAFNIAAEPVLHPDDLAALFDARAVEVPPRLVRPVLSAAWSAHLVPAAPDLLDAVLRLPIMDTARARLELGWVPRTGAAEAVAELLTGLREGATGDTPPLSGRAGGRGRAHEVATGVGERP
jgi:nucleoside-diphosphate-sugar epimerase